MLDTTVEINAVLWFDLSSSVIGGPSEGIHYTNIYPIKRYCKVCGRCNASWLEASIDDDAQCALLHCIHSASNCLSLDSGSLVYNLFYNIYGI
jgi:hypothetical protein